MLRLDRGHLALDVVLAVAVVALVGLAAAELDDADLVRIIGVDDIGGDQPGSSPADNTLPDAPEPSSAWDTEVTKPKAAGSKDSRPEDEVAYATDAEPDDDVTGSALPVPMDNHPEFAEDNDALLPVPMESPQLAPHLLDLKVRAQEALIERMGARVLGPDEARAKIGLN